ncbi:unnamed protein product [Spirodela intermedia]|uniref:Cyanobacterial aminoacyl-tRNA synthetase CAAD domain-containing protein n=2 Tax=Spirodela intermedia TaxID=51605 RepID=A0A7I8IT83_SPIIN|nr:unnamed protein product [Spirodela intermedia]CAA6661004.1 unnamed protein product [Spirodela intermedia]CAA7397365.1 unnamed protein product [Spirodela intermedia]
MAYASAVGMPSLFYGGKRALSGNARELRGRKGYKGIVAKAAGDSSDSSSPSIAEIVQNAWGNSDDRLGIVGVGFASIAVFWASVNLITAIDSLPFVPSALEFIGILFSWWFIYRYLLFKPDREELLKNLKGSLSDILGR